MAIYLFSSSLFILVKFITFENSYMIPVSKKYIAVFGYTMGALCGVTLPGPINR